MIGANPSTLRVDKPFQLDSSGAYTSPKSNEFLVSKTDFGVFLYRYNRTHMSMTMIAPIVATAATAEVGNELALDAASELAFEDNEGTSDGERVGDIVGLSDGFKEEEDKVDGVNTEDGNPRTVTDDKLP